MSIEFKTNEDSLKVDICGYEMYFDFDELVIIHSGPYVIKAIAKKHSNSELFLYYSDNGLFMIKDGKSIEIEEGFKFDEDGLTVEVDLFWKMQK